MRLNPFNTKVGVALGGGAAKGIAHIGVLKAFEEENIEISYISGTSVGSIIASYYAFGKEVQDLTKVADKLRAKEVLKFMFNKKGFVSTDSIRSMILEDIGDKKIEEAIIPLAICTTDILTGESVIFTKGSLADAVCASIAVPGIFTPVEINGRTLVDGGITQNVPVDVLEKMGAGILIGVDLNGVKKYPNVDGVLDVINNAIDIAIDHSTKEQLEEADMVISLDLGIYSKFDNEKKKNELIQIGNQEARKSLRKLFWYKKINFYYIKNFVLEMIPFKIPKLFTRTK